MADTRAQREVEDWIRREWLPSRFVKPFSKEPVRLCPGGLFEFDAVSGDRQIIASISTSGAVTTGGKGGAGKKNKIRADMYFLLLAPAERRMLVLTEKDMFEWCEREREAGKVPPSIGFHLADIPHDLRRKLESSRATASREVPPQ